MIARVPLNYAIMIEQVKSKGTNEERILQALQKREIALFELAGKGLPNWETLIQYYDENPEKVEKIIRDDYTITFLTKGTLKRLLFIKYQLKEGVDFEDKGESLQMITLLNTDFSVFSTILADNWEIDKKEQNGQYVSFIVKLVQSA